MYEGERIIGKIGGAVRQRGFDTHCLQRIGILVFW